MVHAKESSYTIILWKELKKKEGEILGETEATTVIKQDIVRLQITESENQCRVKITLLNWDWRNPRTNPLSAMNCLDFRAVIQPKTHKVVVGLK